MRTLIVWAIIASPLWVTALVMVIRAWREIAARRAWRVGPGEPWGTTRTIVNDGRTVRVSSVRSPKHRDWLEVRKVTK